MLVVHGVGNDAGSDGIGDDVLKGGDILAQRPYDDTFKPIVPDVAVIPKDAVKSRREDAENPLHDSRKTLSGTGMDEEVDVVAHDAEIVNAEGVLLLCPTDHVKKEFFYPVRTKDELASVCPGNNVVPSSWSQFSWFSHTSYTGELSTLLREAKNNSNLLPDSSISCCGA
jgi:hypothetical protein